MKITKSEQSPAVGIGEAQVVGRDSTRQRDPSGRVSTRIGQPDPLMQVSKRFEALFVNEMIASMRKTIVRGGLVPESHAEKVYQSMLDFEHASRVAESGQLGLSRMIYDHLLRTQNRR
jgi:Rod binding domain-containing protein